MLIINYQGAPPAVQQCPQTGAKRGMHQRSPSGDKIQGYERK